MQNILTLLFFFIVMSASQLALTATVEKKPPADTKGCANHSKTRQLLWGDLHIHTRLSMDAFTFGTRSTPSDAYRFARGEKINLVPGAPAVQLDRPLDFAATTDHASDAGATRLCHTPGSASYDTPACKRFRQPINLHDTDNVNEIVKRMVKQTGGLLSSAEVCGNDGALCLNEEKAIWQDIQRAAAEHNDVSTDCEFTTFVAYEYTATPDLTKIHRNVIFKNDRVIEQPISFNEEPDETVLWQRLQNECIDSNSGCDVLAIPHNSNLSNGNLFTVSYDENLSLEQQKKLTKLRQAMEPVVEIMQMKGDSECRNNMWNVLGETDEYCQWEKMRAPETPDCKGSTSKGALIGEGCVSTLDYARYALVEGIKEKHRLGINPYQFGFIASTDTHDGSPGSVEEWRSDLPGNAPNIMPGRNNGGLVAVWAEENSRASIFESLRRREVFGTSGPRISVRLFAGSEMDTSWCEQPDWLDQAYQSGTPMGGIISPTILAGKAPSFILSAQQDSGTQTHPGNLLQQAQIIKGWTDSKGRIHQSVFTVAGGANNATVDPSNCSVSGPGHKQLCQVWQDPEFNPKQDAVYYARIIENPSCRSTGWTCTDDAPNRPNWCDQPKKGTTIERLTQERAWTSPIWYEAAAE